MTAAAVTGESPHGETIATLRRQIETTFPALDRWFDRPAAERVLVPADVGWPMETILEHVSLVNHFLLLTLRKGVERAIRRAAQNPIPPVPSDLSIFGDIADPDAFDWQPPEHMIPRGSSPLVDVRSTLTAQHRECRDLLERMSGGEGVLHRVRMSVRGLGMLDMYQWLCFLLMHSRRHLVQMERALQNEVRHVG